MDIAVKEPPSTQPEWVEVGRVINMPVRVLKTQSGYDVYVDLEKAGSFPTADDVNKFLEDLQRKLTHFSWGVFWNGSSPAPDLPDAVYKALLKRANVPLEEWDKYLKDIRSFFDVERSQRAFLDLVARVYGEKPEYTVKVGELEYKFESLYKAEEFLEEVKKWTYEDYFKRLVKEKYGVELPNVPQSPTNTNIYRGDWFNIIPPYPKELKGGTQYLDVKFFEDYKKLERQIIENLKGVDLSFLSPERNFLYGFSQAFRGFSRLIPENNIPVLKQISDISGSIGEFLTGAFFAAIGKPEWKEVNPWEEFAKKVEEGKVPPWIASTYEARTAREALVSGYMYGQAASLAGWSALYGFALPKLFGKLDEILDVSGFIRYEVNRVKPLQNIASGLEKIGEKLGVVEKRYYAPEAVEVRGYFESVPGEGVKAVRIGRFEGKVDVTDLVKQYKQLLEPRAGYLPLEGGLKVPYSPTEKFSVGLGFDRKVIGYYSPEKFFEAGKFAKTESLYPPSAFSFRLPIDYEALVKDLEKSIESGFKPFTVTGGKAASSGGGLLSQTLEKIASGFKNVAVPVVKAETKLKTNFLANIAAGLKTIQLPKPPSLDTKTLEAATPRLEVKTESREVQLPGAGLSLEIKPLKTEAEKPSNIEGAVPRLSPEKEFKVKPLPVMPTSMPPVQVPRIDQVVRDLVKEVQKITTKLDVPKLTVPTMRIPAPTPPPPNVPVPRIPMPRLPLLGGLGGYLLYQPKGGKYYRYWDVEWLKPPSQVKLPKQAKLPRLPEVKELSLSKSGEGRRRRGRGRRVSSDE